MAPILYGWTNRSHIWDDMASDAAVSRNLASRAPASSQQIQAAHRAGMQAPELRQPRRPSQAASAGRQSGFATAAQELLARPDRHRCAPGRSNARTMSGQE